MDRSSFNDIRRYPSRPQPPSCSCNQPPPPPLPSFGHGCNNPIFAGKKPLAYLEDLAALHGEVLKWLIGPDGEFSNNGYKLFGKLSDVVHGEYDEEIALEKFSAFYRLVTGIIENIKSKEEFQSAQQALGLSESGDKNE